METTYTQEDYIRAIYLLSLETENVKTSALVKSLELSKSTVTQRLQSLKEHGWIEHEKYGPVKLSKKGLKKAENLTYKHRIIEHFLHQVLEIPETEVHAEAHKLEHAFSNKVIQKLAAFLNNPQNCPHGQKLPPLPRRD